MGCGGRKWDYNREGNMSGSRDVIGIWLSSASIPEGEDSRGGGRSCKRPLCLETPFSRLPDS